MSIYKHIFMAFLCLNCLFFFNASSVFAQKVVTKDYNYYQESYKKKRKAAKTLSFISGTCLLAGTSVVILESRESYNSANENSGMGFLLPIALGVITYTGGIVTGVVSVPMWIVSGNHKKKAIRLQPQMNTSVIGGKTFQNIGIKVQF